MATARLRDSLNLNSGDRFFMLHGPGVLDAFVSDDYRMLSGEEALHEWLSAEGFERIVFYTPRQALHFRDAESLSRSRPPRAQAGVAPNQTRRLSGGPLGRKSQLRQQPQNEAAPRRMGDAHAIRFVDTILRASEPRTAIVIHQAEVTLRHFEDPKTLVRALGDWAKLDIFNRNICLFLFGGPVDELARDLREWPELHAELVKGEPGERGNVARLGSPDLEELQRLIDFARLTNDKGRAQRVAVNWQERDKLAMVMAAENQSVRFWLPRLREAGEVSWAAAKAAKKNPWFKPSSNISADDRPALERLREMPGLEPVKQRIAELTAFVAEEMRRREAGFNSAAEPPSLHMVFAGNPGTGKTTVARLVGEIYRDLGLLKRGHTVEVDQVSKLVAGYVGQTAIRTHARIDEALDGILFIDEAYQLADTSRGEFGREAIDALVTRTENDRHRLVVIVAGYTERMREFRLANDGLPSRFPDENIVLFPDYEPEDLLEILHIEIKKRGYELAPQDGGEFLRLVESMYRTGKATGNGRDMRTLAGTLVRLRAPRVQNQGLPVDEPIRIADVPEHLQPLLNT